MFDKFSCLIKLQSQTVSTISRVHCKAAKQMSSATFCCWRSSNFLSKWIIRQQTCCCWMKSELIPFFCDAGEEFCHIFPLIERISSDIAFNIPQWCYFTDQKFRWVQGAYCEALCGSPATAHRSPCFGFVVSAVLMFRWNNSAVVVTLLYPVG